MSDVKPRPFFYLASPFSDPDPAVRQKRFEDITAIGKKLTIEGINLFCPITQSVTLQNIKEQAVGEQTISHERWMDVDYSFLSRAAGLLVVRLPGWDTSRGVALEIEYARTHDIPIQYLEVDEEGGLYDPFLGDLPWWEEAEYKTICKVKALAQTRGEDFQNFYKQLFGQEPPELSKAPSDGVISTDIIPGVKDSAEKDNLMFVPYAALAAIAGIRQYGNQKYGDPAKWYEHPEAQNQFVEAAMRHIGKYFDATFYKNRSVDDEESGLPHLDHALTSLAMAVALRDKPKGVDSE